MSTKYFQPFEKIYYKFGDEVSLTLFQNLTQYVDAIDQIKSQQALYEDYIIRSGDRPDTLSLQLYGDPKYYWTFFLINDDLRESGWPLRNEEIASKAKEFYPHRVITITSDISSAEGGYDFRVGRRVIGNNSGTHGTIIKRNLDLGQLIVDTVHDFQPVEPDRVYSLDVNGNGAAELTLTDPLEFFVDPDEWIISRTDLNDPDADPVTLSNYTIQLEEIATKAVIRSIPFRVGNFEYTLQPKITKRNQEESKYEDGEVLRLFDQTTGLEVQKLIHKETSQVEAVHHYENSNGDWVDIDPYNPTIPSGLIPVTNLARLQNKNDDLKQIKIAKPEVVETLVKEFYRLMAER